MGKKVGDWNRLNPAKNPYARPWKLNRNSCSDDLFTMRYNHMVHDILKFPDEDEFRDWVIDNRGKFSYLHIAIAMDVSRQWFYRWLNKRDVSMNLEKAVRLYKYLRAYNRESTDFYFPDSRTIANTLIMMQKDGFYFASAEYVSWYFRSDWDKLEDWYALSSGKDVQNYMTKSSKNREDVQNYMTWKRAKKYVFFVLREYDEAFRLVRDGLSWVLFGDDF